MNSYTTVKTMLNLPPAAFFFKHSSTCHPGSDVTKWTTILQQISSISDFSANKSLTFWCRFPFTFRASSEKRCFFYQKATEIKYKYTHTHAETLKFLKAKQNSLWKNENKFRENAATNVGHLLKRARNTRDFCFFSLLKFSSESARMAKDTGVD